jgi:hypothetical protein
MVFPEAKGLTFHSKRLNIPIITSRTHCFHLLPRCYQDRANWPDLAPYRGSPGLWFLVGLGCLKWY